MKLIPGLAALAAIGAHVTWTQDAFAQDGQQPAIDSQRLLSNGASATPVEAPLPAEAAPALTPISVSAPAGIVASGWTGPVNFSPIAVADLIIKVCRASVTGDGGDLSARAVQLGLGPAGLAQEDLSRALPPGAVTWRVPTIDGVVYLFGYGEEPLSCGAAILRPLAEDCFNKVTALLQDAQIGFASDSTQILQGEVRWERLRSAKGEFIDLMEYPANSERPGILRADFLPG